MGHIIFALFLRVFTYALMSKIIATTGNGLNPKPKLVYDFTGHGASDIRYHGVTYSQAESDMSQC